MNPAVSLPGGGTQRFTEHPAVVDVLVVSSRAACVPTVREVLTRWPVQVNVRWAADPVDALRQVLAAPPTLAIVDARLDRSGGRALVAQLLRWRAELEVLAFDEALEEPPSGMSVWHWRELPAVLRWWAQRHLKAEATVVSSGPRP